MTVCVASVIANCDTPEDDYLFSYAILITYGKKGDIIDIIDYEAILYSDDRYYCIMEPSEGEYGFVYTQYSFYDVTEVYSGKCDVAEYEML